MLLRASVVGANATGHKAVEAEPACHSDAEPFTQILNLGGGVVEWEDSCEASSCRARGARQRNAPDEIAEGCDEPGLRSGPGEDLGFRCCKPLSPTP